MFGGFHAGYNYQWPSRLLLGVEADVAFPNFLETDDVVLSRPTTHGSTVYERLDYIATLRARAGRAFDRWMIYGTGGVAWSQARFAETFDASGFNNEILRPRMGWTLGAGIEAIVTPQWTARLEYLHYWLGSANAPFASGADLRSTQNIDAVRVGLNWHPAGSSSRLPSPGAADGPLLDPARWNIHGQSTLIGQGYFRFRSPYEGANSLSGNAQAKNTGSATAFIGFRAWEGGEIYVNPEIMQGFGLSDVHGVAGFPNGEAQKSNFPIPRFNMARLFLRQTFGLGGEQETIADGANQLAGKQDISRVTVTVGKFAVPDIFDGNAYANDPRTTFLNWNIYGGGSYDWTMDKLSWTWGGIVDLNQKYWALRTGYFLLPATSNSNFFDKHAPERGEYVAELELRYALAARPGKLRVFGWLNHGLMGGYTDALALPPTSPNYPDIALTRRVRTNYGVVVSAEQAITEDVGVFSRASWSPGLVEIAGWTDCDASISLGAVVKGTAWGRPADRIGIAGVAESLSPQARAYFAAGGLGILIGDGRLNYRPEKILETYYAYAINDWTTLSFDYQYVRNPGYNADRGPVSIFAGRLHFEF